MQSILSLLWLGGVIVQSPSWKRSCCNNSVIGHLYLSLYESNHSHLICAQEGFEVLLLTRPVKAPYVPGYDAIH